MTTRAKSLIVVGVVVVGGLIVAYRIISGGPPSDARRQTAPLVKLEPVRRETVSTVLRFTGDVTAIQQASIFSKVSGNLEQCYADMGMPVRQNQLLALIDTTELHQQYQQAAATFENARMSYQRTKDLFEQNLVAKQDLDNSEAAKKVSGAAFETAKTRLRYAWITAPFAGTVTRRFLDPGALVTPNSSTLFTLMDLDKMKIIVNVLEKDIPSVTIGKSAVVAVDAFPGKTFSGSVRRFSEAVDPATRTMAVEIDLSNENHILKPGMFANVMLIVGERVDAITIPTEALLKDDRGFFVYTVVRDSAWQNRVRRGVEQGDRTEIEGGLSDSSQVISVGQQFVKDRGPVTIQR
jgi:RND family efflux transporter MFP subunit